MIDSIRISATMTEATGSCGSLISYNDWKTVYQSRRELCIKNPWCESFI